MAASKVRQQRMRGEVEALPSGSFRVRVYAGLDPLTRKRHYLTEVVPAGPKAAREAEKVRTRFLAEVDERRNPRTNATVNHPVPPVSASNGDGTPALPAATIDVPYSDSPYRQIAADLRAAIRCGALAPGTEFPTVKSLAARYSVSEGTAHRAMALLSEAGEIVVSRGRRAVVIERDASSTAS